MSRRERRHASGQQSTEVGVPADFNPDAQAKHPLPEGWSVVWYGVKSASMRRRLREVCGRNGLRKCDRGGSVYIGVSLPALDREIQRLADILTKGDVHLVPGSYAQTEAGFFTRGLADQALQDISQVEREVRLLEKAMAGDGEIVNPKTGRPRNLATTGDGRFETADYVLTSVDTAAQRLRSHPGTADMGERLATRAAQVQAWVSKVRAYHAARRAQFDATFRAQEAAAKAAPGGGGGRGE